MASLLSYSDACSYSKLSISLQTKLKRLLQCLYFNDMKKAAMQGVALDDVESSESGDRLLIFYLLC